MEEGRLALAVVVVVADSKDNIMPKERKEKRKNWFLFDVLPHYFNVNFASYNEMEKGK